MTLLKLKKNILTKILSIKKIKSNQYRLKKEKNRINPYTTKNKLIEKIQNIRLFLGRTKKNTHYTLKF